MKWHSLAIVILLSLKSTSFLMFVYFYQLSAVECFHGMVFFPMLVLWAILHLYI
jgi:hypothetical protein